MCGRVRELVHEGCLGLFGLIIFDVIGADEDRKSDQIGLVEAGAQRDSPAEAGSDESGVVCPNRVQERHDVDGVLSPGVAGRVGAGGVAVATNVGSTTGYRSAS